MAVWSTKMPFSIANWTRCLPPMLTLCVRIRWVHVQLSNAVSIVIWVPSGGNPPDSRLDQYLPAPELTQKGYVTILEPGESTHDFLV
eukprot:scaffold53722_cov66-Phaeocystis_antarctica.AAC.2